MTITESTLVYTDDEQTAIAAVIEAGRASTKVLQSALGIGYRRASALITELERRGVIGPDRGTRGREVLVDAQAITDEPDPTPPTSPPPPADEPSPAAGPPVLELVNPATLLVDPGRNVRHAMHLNPEFVESIRDLGVLQPIVALRLPDGQLQVRHGHRRTLAACEVGRDQVPVVVIDVDAELDPADVDTERVGAAMATRIVEQWAENEHRAGLSTSERVDAIEQLSLLQVPADQIARRTKATRAQVDAALSVAATPKARKVVETHPLVTIDQAAALAGIDDDEQVQRLVGLLEEYPDEFDHEMAEVVVEQQIQRLRTARRDELMAASVYVLDEPPSHRAEAEVVDIRYLTDEHGTKLDAAHHALHCTGHAVFVGERWDEDAGTSVADDVVGCIGWEANGHRDPYARRTSGAPAPAPASASATDKQAAIDAAREAEAEKVRAERREVLENNKAARAAETVRRTWLRDYLAASTPPKGAARFIATEMSLMGSWYDGLAHGANNSNSGLIIRELLGHLVSGGADDLKAKVENATDNRATVLTLAHLIGWHESELGVDAWRTKQRRAARYLTFLAEQGYDLSRVEKLAAGIKPGRKPKNATTS